MTVSWKEYEGEVINNTFPLRQYLRGSGHSAVFLTQLSGPQPSKAALKLVPAGEFADVQLSLWRRGAQLSHPNLLGLHQSGRCQLADMDLLYVVMEYAEEDLSQILPERPLAASEARDMLEPVLDTLTYLHGQGLVHSHIKPSNILATGDRLKLSSDTLFPSGEFRRFRGEFDVYVPPECATLALTPASDVWSLGMTLVEALTQRALEWQPTSQADPVVPENLPQPFLDIVQHALKVDPKLRWTIAEIRVSLNPAAAAAAAAHSVSPLAVPLSPISAVPAAKLRTPKPVQPVPTAPSPQPSYASAPKQPIVLPNYVIPIAVAAIVIAAILALPRILGHRAETASSAPPAAAAPASEPKPAGKPARSGASRSAKASAPPATQDSVNTAAGKKPAEQISPAPIVSPAPAKLRTETVPSADVAKKPATGAGHGEVLDQVLPDVSDKARATIQGTVRVAVRVHVDAAGNVSDAGLDAPGPSQFFADLALNAARRWEFTPPEVAGRSAPSEWLIRFEFSQSSVQAFPTQTAP
jgi:TonB family protein